jgi:predicted RNA-binding Zn-ribbon protein involved in translation (DUF1610 family)
MVVARGLRNRCPNCGEPTLFREGTWFEVNKACPVCGLQIERDEGFFIGSMSLNYGVTLVCFLLPVLLLAYKGVIGTATAVVIAGAGSVGFPIAFYRSSRSWWLMQYYLLFPLHLPANKLPADPGPGDHNA